MKPQTKRNLFRIGGTVAGSLLGGPVGAGIGGAAGTALGATVPDETPEEITRTVYPEVSPMASHSRQKITRPTQHIQFQDRVPSPFGRGLDLMTPLFMGAASSGLMGDTPSLFAQEGMAIPDEAPTHEEGGVDVEVEGGEIILNEEQQAYIQAGNTPEEQAQRYHEVVAMLKEKGMEEGPVAAEGMAVPGHIRFANQYWNTVSHGEPQKAPRIESPGFSVNLKDNLQPYATSGINIDASDSSETPNLNVFGRGAKGMEGLSRAGVASDLAKAFTHGASLFRPQMPVSQPFTASPVQAPTFRFDRGRQQADLDQHLGQGISLMNTMPSEARLAGLSNLMEQQMVGRRDIARGATEIDNLNQEAATQAANLTAERQLGVDMANYERLMQENQLEHMRKNLGLAGMFQAGDAALKKRGDSLMSGLSLEFLSELQESMKPDEFAQVLQTLGIRF